MTASEVAQYLRQNDRYLIISHRNPDGDTLGCAGAICSALREIGKTAYVLNNEQITKRYEEYVSEFIAPEDYVPETILTADVARLEMLPDNAGRYAVCTSPACHSEEDQPPPCTHLPALPEYRYQDRSP